MPQNHKPLLELATLDCATVIDIKFEIGRAEAACSFQCLFPKVVWHHVYESSYCYNSLEGNFSTVFIVISKSQVYAYYTFKGLLYP